MYSSTGVLIFGFDPVLLETRRLVLNRAGFQVWIAAKASEAVDFLLNEPIDLFILCQSLPPDVCERTLETAHTLRPDMINLLLGRQKFGIPTDDNDTFLTNFLDPLALIDFIQNKISG